MNTLDCLWPPRRIRIFLASSNELRPTRDAVELWLRRLNDELLDANVAFVVVRWEEESMALHEPRAQDRYNEELEKCDGLIALFGKRVGSYTKEEFQIAYDRFRGGQLPKKILVCFDNFKVDMKDVDQGVQDVIQLRDELRRRGQVFTFFDSESELRQIVEREGRSWARHFASTTQLFHLTEEMLDREVGEMPTTVTADREVLSYQSVRTLCDRLGLLGRRRINGHLAFEDGDVAYFARLQEPGSRLEAKLRSRKLILN